MKENLWDYQNPKTFEDMLDVSKKRNEAYRLRPKHQNTMSFKEFARDQISKSNKVIFVAENKTFSSREKALNYLKHNSDLIFIVEKKEFLKLLKLAKAANSSKPIEWAMTRLSPVYIYGTL